MNTWDIQSWVSQIHVSCQPEADVEVLNDSPLLMIGRGRQGAVFRISDDVCVKVYGTQKDCDREYYALSLGQHTGLFPQVYEKGENYIVQEYVTGVDLREYLQSQPLAPQLSLKVIQMLVTFKRIGFDRIDHHKRQIYLQPNGELKVIDVGRTVWRDRVYPYPRKLLNSLGEEHRAVFLSHVEMMVPELFQEWQYYIQLEDFAHEVYQRLLAEPYDPNANDLKEMSSTLRTSADPSVCTVQIKALLYHVFKEEWNRRMQGHREDDLLQEVKTKRPKEETQAKESKETKQRKSKKMHARKPKEMKAKESKEMNAKKKARKIGPRGEKRHIPPRNRGRR